MEDDQLLEYLPLAKETEIQRVYKQFRPGFKNVMMKIFNCQEQLVLDVYPEAFTHFYFNIKKGKISKPLESKLITYLIAIGKNIFKTRHRNTYQKKIILEDEFSKYESKVIVQDIRAQKENIQMAKDLLNRIGQPCKDILTLFYIKNYSIESIRNELNLISEGAVRKKKFDCILQMRKLIGHE